MEYTEFQMYALFSVHGQIYLKSIVWSNLEGGVEENL